MVLIGLLQFIFITKETTREEKFPLKFGIKVRKYWKTPIKRRLFRCFRNLQRRQRVSYFLLVWRDAFLGDSVPQEGHFLQSKLTLRKEFKSSFLYSIKNSLEVRQKLFESRGSSAKIVNVLKTVIGHCALVETFSHEGAKCTKRCTQTLLEAQVCKKAREKSERSCTESGSAIWRTW